MLLDLNGIIYSLSYALDCIEAEIVGVDADHAKWVAFLSARIGKEYGLSQKELADLSACAALHDNALTQYIAEEKSENQSIGILGGHSAAGEKNMEDFPFYEETRNFVLYHHENADGSGPFGKKADETPIEAQIIHMADMLDVNCRFHEISEETYKKILAYLSGTKGSIFSAELTESFLRVMPPEKYLSLSSLKIDDILQDELPHRIADYPFESVCRVMKAFGRIVDYKSEFTRNHSDKIAEKLYKMAKIYGYDEEKAERLFIAGALHDIGKMAIGNDILEKPDKLSNEEFARMKNHAYQTYVILSRVDDFGDIVRHASHHHEKLNGKGYPFGLKAEELDEQDRLVCCIDIYQALSEDRPYKKGMPHDKCMEIMRKMVENGEIDGKITEDVNRVFGA